MAFGGFQDGFEIGNHSQSHDYGLARRLPAEIAREVQEGHASISAAVGVALGLVRNTRLM